MKKIESKEKYTDLLKVFLAQDMGRKDSIMKTTVLNKLINYLYIKLPEDEKPQLLEVLKSGIDENFLEFVGEKLDEKDVKAIARSASEEFANIFNYSLIANTDGK